MYQTGKTVYDHILKHQEKNWKRDAQLSIFDELGGVCNFHQTVGASHSTKNSGLNFRKLSHVEGNGNFHQAGPILFRSRLSTFPAKIYSTKCWRIMIRGLSWVRKLLQESNLIRIHDYFSQTRPWYLPDRLKHHFRVMRETYELCKPGEYPQKIRNDQSTIFKRDGLLTSLRNLYPVYNVVQPLVSDSVKRREN